MVEFMMRRGANVAIWFYHMTLPGRQNITPTQRDGSDFCNAIKFQL